MKKHKKLLFTCYYLTNNGWLRFNKKFNNKNDALKYCNNKTAYKGSPIVNITLLKDNL